MNDTQMKVGNYLFSYGTYKLNYQISILKKMSSFFYMWCRVTL